MVLTFEKKSQRVKTHYLKKRNSRRPSIKKWKEGKWVGGNERLSPTRKRGTGGDRLKEKLKFPLRETKKNGNAKRKTPVKTAANHRKKKKNKKQTTKNQNSDNSKKNKAGEGKRKRER